MSLIFLHDIIKNYDKYEKSFVEWTTCIFQAFDGIHDSTWKSVCGEHPKDRIDTSIVISLYVSVGGFAIFVSLIYIRRIQKLLYSYCQRTVIRHFRQRWHLKVRVHVHNIHARPKLLLSPQTSDEKNAILLENSDLNRRNQIRIVRCHRRGSVIVYDSRNERADEDIRGLHIAHSHDTVVDENGQLGKLACIDEFDEEADDRDDEEVDEEFDYAQELDALRHYADDRDMSPFHHNDEYSLSSDWISHSADSLLSSNTRGNSSNDKLLVGQ
jgi:hypothetical protein